MIRLIWLLALLLTAAPACADSDISTADLPYLGPMQGGDQVVTTRSGTTGNSSWPPLSLPLPDISTNGGIYALAGQETNQWVAYIGTDGVQHTLQPSFGDISGTLGAAQLPLPSSSSLGGVQSFAGAANHFMTGISTSGVPTHAQVAFSNLSGTISTGQLPASGVTASSYTCTNLTVDSTGRVTTASNGTCSGGGTPSGPAGGDLSGTYPNPNVASIRNITTGTLGISHGGTNSTTAAGALASLNGLPAYPTRRPPTPNDDTSLGYTTSSFWYNEGTFWNSISTTSGQANWQFQHLNNAPVCDLVACAEAHGVFKLKNSYAGSAFEITRASDSTKLNVGFDNSGIADWAATDTFCAGTSCTVDTWYDQSGNSNDLAQTTTASQPAIFGSYVGKLRSITFNGKSMTNTTLSISSTQNVSAVFVGRWQLSQSGSAGTGRTLWEFGNPTHKLTAFQPVSNPNCFSINSSNSVSTLSGRCLVTASPQVSIFVSNAGAATMSQNNIISSFGGGTISAVSSTGFEVGQNNIVSNWPGQYDALAFVVVNSSLSNANQQAVTQSLLQASKIQPQITDNFLFVGDSITAGTTNSPAGLDVIHPQELETTLKHPYNFYNVGLGAETAFTMQSDAVFFAPKVYLSGATNIVVVWACRNDLAGGTTVTPAQCYGYLVNICSTYKGAGFNKCILVTPPPTNVTTGGQTNSGYESERQTLASLIRAGVGVDSDGVIDVTADPIMGPQAAASNTSLWFDGIHPQNPIGTSYLASIFMQGLSSYNQ